LTPITAASLPDVDETSELAGAGICPVHFGSAIDKFLRQKLGYRYKKYVVTSKQSRDDVAAAHEQWQA
jgi:hypothetical protein